MVRLLLLLLIALHGLTGCASRSGVKDGVAAGPAELTPLQESVKLKVRWKASVGKNDKRFLNLNLAYEGKRIYATSYKGVVQAFDAQSGKRIWKADTKLMVSSGPGVGEGLVLLGTRDGEVIALNAEDGRKIWAAQVTGEVLAVPRAASGVVGVQTASGDLIGLDVQDGKRRWIYDRSVPTLTLRGTGSPVISNGLIVGGFASGKLSAIDIKNGRMVWEVSVAMPRGRSELERMVDIDASPIIQDGVVYAVSYQGKIAALDLATGEILWSRDMSSSAGLGVDYGRIYVTDEQSDVLALDLRNSATQWKQEALHGRALTAPVPFQDIIAVGDFEGYLHLLEPADGSLVGRARVDRSGISATPLVVEDTLYVLGKGGILAAYEVQQNKKKPGKEISNLIMPEKPEQP